MRSYEQYCALAKALDVVGDRWTLLIVRELLIRGRCRYTDLRDGLPGIATNLLADRLRDLEEAELVTKELAPPPIATALYELTPRGMELEPVLQQLGRWGAPLLSRKSKRDVFRPHWMAIPLGMHLTDNTPAEPPVSVELRAGDQPLTLETTGDGSVRTQVGPASQPNVTIEGDGPTILKLLMDKITLRDARAAGVRYAGDPKVLRRLQRK